MRMLIFQPTHPRKVTEAAQRHRHGSVSRADLLEALQRQPLAWFELPAVGTSNPDGAYGYVLEAPEFQLPLLLKRPPPEAVRQKRALLQVPRMWAVVKDETLPTGDDGQGVALSHCSCAPTRFHASRAERLLVA